MQFGLRRQWGRLGGDGDPQHNEGREEEGAATAHGNLKAIRAVPGFGDCYGSTASQSRLGHFAVLPEILTMCTSDPKPPKVVERDPVAEAAKAERLAAIEANKNLAGRRKRYRASSLSTHGGRGYTSPAGESAIAKASPGA